jgi:hypothetical protein
MLMWMRARLLRAALRIATAKPALPLPALVRNRTTRPRALALACDSAADHLLGRLSTRVFLAHRHKLLGKATARVFLVDPVHRVLVIAKLKPKPSAPRLPVSDASHSHSHPPAHSRNPSLSASTTPSTTALASPLLAVPRPPAYYNSLSATRTQARPRLPVIFERERDRGPVARASVLSVVFSPPADRDGPDAADAVCPHDGDVANSSPSEGRPYVSRLCSLPSPAAMAAAAAADDDDDEQVFSPFVAPDAAGDIDAFALDEPVVAHRQYVHPDARAVVEKLRTTHVFAQSVVLRSRNVRLVKTNGCVVELAVKGSSDNREWDRELPWEQMHGGEADDMDVSSSLEALADACGGSMPKNGEKRSKFVFDKELCAEFVFVFSDYLTMPKDSHLDGVL